jgi:hypothetical protein
MFWLYGRRAKQPLILGFGYLRHVWLNVAGKVRVSLWGVYITTSQVSRASAEATVAARTENRGATPGELAVRVRLLDPANAVAAIKRGYSQRGGR